MISRKATQLQIREQENHNNGKIDSMIEDAFERYLTSGVDVNRNRRKYEIFSLESVRRDILGIARVPSESGYQDQDKAHVTCHVSAFGHVDHITSSRLSPDLSRRWHPQFSVTTTSLLNLWKLLCF